MLIEGVFSEIELELEERGLFKKFPKSLRILIITNNMMQICGNM
jgi:hypothetical protein